MTTVQAVHGMGGVGKTHTAIEYAYRNAADYDVAWFMDAEKPGLFAGQFGALGAELGVPPKLDAEATVRAVGGELRRRGRWLLILDNAEEVNHIRPVLPGGGGHVLITTRRGGFRAVGSVLDLDVLARDEAIALAPAHLRKRLGPSCRHPRPPRSRTDRPWRRQRCPADAETCPAHRPTPVDRRNSTPVRHG